MQTEIIGILGASILVIAWLINLIRTLKSRAHTRDPTFTAVYIVASALLTYYSILTGSLLFSVLNGTATFLALLEYLAFWYFKQ